MATSHKYGFGAKDVPYSVSEPTRPYSQPSQKVRNFLQLKSSISIMELLGHSPAILGVGCESFSNSGHSGMSSGAAVNAMVHLVTKYRRTGTAGEFNGIHRMPVCKAPDFSLPIAR